MPQETPLIAELMKVALLFLPRFLTKNRNSRKGQSRYRRYRATGNKRKTAKLGLAEFALRLGPKLLSELRNPNRTDP